MAGAFILRNIDGFFSNLQKSKREKEKYKEDEKNILPYKPLVHSFYFLFLLSGFPLYFSNDCLESQNRPRM